MAYSMKNHEDRIKALETQSSSTPTVSVVLNSIKKYSSTLTFTIKSTDDYLVVEDSLLDSHYVNSYNSFVIPIGLLKLKHWYNGILVGSYEYQGLDISLVGNNLNIKPIELNSNLTHNIRYVATIKLYHNFIEWLKGWWS